MKTNALRSILRRRRVIASVAALVLLAGAAAAGAERRGPAPANGAWKTECGACHLAYPPHLLPARSWRAIMGGLDKHFGTDASLDPAAAAEIAAFLERHGGRDRGPTPSLRITETPWFQHEHRKIGAAIWARPAIKGPANCPACHAGADRGDYDDDTVRIPR
jgi:diheme cytochrome c